MIFNRKQVNLLIEQQNYFKKILDNFEGREKGKVRQRLILFFLMQFKYATQKQLSILIDDKHRNISKILRKLEDQQYIKLDKYFSLKIISITKRGLEEIAERYTEYFENKEKYDKQLSFLEHQLHLRSFAIVYNSNEQIVINDNIYRKIIYRLIKENYGEATANKLFKDHHRADLTIIKGNVSIGFEFENSLKKRDKVKEKLNSMIKNMGIFHQGYFFKSRKKYILENFMEKAFSFKGSNEIFSLLTTTNLYSIRAGQSPNLIPQIVEDLEVEPLIREIKPVFSFENYI